MRRGAVAASGHGVTVSACRAPWPAINDRRAGGQASGAPFQAGHERAGGRQVVPLCPFIKGWIDKHPDYAGLLKA